MRWQDPQTLGQRLRYVRKCRRYQLDTLCKYADLEKSSVKDWEGGKRAIPHLTLRRWAYYLQVDLLWLVTGEGPLPCVPLTTAQLIMAEVDISPETRLSRLRKAFPGHNMLPDLPG